MPCGLLGYEIYPQSMAEGCNGTSVIIYQYRRSYFEVSNLIFIAKKIIPSRVINFNHFYSEADSGIRIV
jgi:hypothetical protein